MTTKRLIAVLILLGRGEAVPARSFEAVRVRKMACPQCQKPTRHASTWIATHGKVPSLPTCACGWDENQERVAEEHRALLEKKLRAYSQPKPRSPIEIMIDRATGRSR